MSMFETKDEGFSEREERILKFWQERDVFKESVRLREDAPHFSAYDGPPFATGLPHYGHILAGAIKDVVLRYKTMQGFYVPRRFGWDCHGLPVENEIEKAKELSGAPSIEAFGIDKFNEECRGIVLRYTEEWKATVDRMGRFVDFDKTYKTMDPTFMESVWWVFSELWKKGLVYEGFKVMPFSAKLGTPLSNFEANLNYQEVDDPSLVVTFPIKGEVGTSLLAWTTTPWTLPSNLAVVVHPDLDYVKIKNGKTGHLYVLAKARVDAYFKEDFEVIETFKGQKLVGLRYEPLFPHFADQQAFRVLSDDFVGADDGTGLVHAAPAFGEQDFFVCSREKIEPVCPVDQNGKFTKEIPEFEGLFVKDADKQIIKGLKESGRIFHHGQIRHRYPFCWRSDSPLIYKAVRTWFVSVEKIKENLIAANEQIQWVPGHLKKGRFGKWLEGARDWAISRNRYWGTPIPIWRSDDGECIAIGSVEELEKRTGKKVNDLHRHFIDDLEFEDNGKTFKRVPEVFDCWFESGSMPYAQNHYPFENREEVMETFPADFIAEGLDQTRGWFYTLNVLSAALFNKPAFKNVIVNGIILAEDGAKMSKRLKNYPEPSLVFDKYGADSVRLYLMHSPVVRGDDMRFTERGVELVLRKFLIPFWNSYAFLATYARIYEWRPEKADFDEPQADIDRWILSELQKLIQKVEEGMDRYELSEAVDPFVDFIDQLTNWYIRRSRSRFWSEEDTSDRREAFETLYTVLNGLARISAPFVPFISDSIYQELRREGDPISVHLCDFPKYDSEKRDVVLEKKMACVKQAVSLGHSLRKEKRVKVRQPLPKVMLITSNEDELASLEKGEDLILEELNVKQALFYKDESSFVNLVVKPNFKTLGRKVGAKMGAVKEAILKLERESVESLLRGGSVTIEGFEIASDDVLIDRKVKEGVAATCVGSLTVALDLTLSEDLLLEGLAREIVNKINTMRRNQDFAVTDRIAVKMETSERVQKAFSLHEDYIRHEILAEAFDFTSCGGEDWDLNGESARIEIKVN